MYHSTRSGASLYSSAYLCSWLNRRRTGPAGHSATKHIPHTKEPGRTAAGGPGLAHKVLEDRLVADVLGLLFTCFATCKVH